MSKSETILTEKCGNLGPQIQYNRTQFNKVTRLRVSSGIAKSVCRRVLGFASSLLLPQGYPDTVSEDYLTYQIWDTVQAFASTIMSTFTTRAILEGIGVGNAEASALTATLTWISKDGTSMIGRILFAWLKGNHLDCYSKQWRLFADFLNDLAMITELLIPYFMSVSVYLLCVTTTMKAIVGVAGGATRASITQHQALRNNMAEIAAKDGSQETVVNLLATVVSIFLLNLIDNRMQWPLILFLVVVHLSANYKAVTSLLFRNLNNHRFYLVLKNYLAINTVLGPSKINKQEAVVLGLSPSIRQLCGCDIKLGESLKRIADKYDSDELGEVISFYGEKNYLIVPDFNRRTIYVCFGRQESSRDVISAYFEAVLLGLAIAIYRNDLLDVYSKRHLHHSTPITRLNTLMSSFHRNREESTHFPVVALLKLLNEQIKTELVMFYTALQYNEWDVDSHAFNVGNWRTCWKDVKKSL